MTARTTLLATTISVAALIAVACGGGSDDDQTVAPNADDFTPPPAGQTTLPAGSDDDSSQPPAGAPPADTGAPDPPGQAPPTADPGSDDAADNPGPTDDGSGAATPPDAPTSIDPALIPQPDPTLTVVDLPARPESFALYGATALPWLQGRTTVAEILPLFETWGMPPIAGGDRLNLVDTNADATGPSDGRSSIAITYTDPATFGAEPVGSNLVIYEPVPGNPGQYRIAYDHNLLQQLVGAPAVRGDIVILRVDDVTGDGQRDIAFQEDHCTDGACIAVTYILSIDGDRYRRTVVESVLGGN
jgi:hypothetical protein